MAFLQDLPTICLSVVGVQGSTEKSWVPANPREHQNGHTNLAYNCIVMLMWVCDLDIIVTFGFWCRELTGQGLYSWATVCLQQLLRNAWNSSSGSTTVHAESLAAHVTIISMVGPWHLLIQLLPNLPRHLLSEMQGPASDVYCRSWTCCHIIVLLCLHCIAWLQCCQRQTSPSVNEEPQACRYT